MIKETICDFDYLYAAMNVCKRGVTWKDSVAGWTKNSIRNVRHLEEDLNNGTYEIDPYIKFVIHEPKRRNITSTRFKDRVVQRSICDNYLIKEISKHFIYDNGACIKGKGTDFARNRLQCFLQKFSRKYGNKGYCLKLDLHDYFGSTPHTLAKNTIAKYCNDEWVREQIYKVIDSFGPTKGIGLGSQISQLIQSANLSSIDHMIKEQLKIKYYVRYMDDFVMIHKSKEYLRECFKRIEHELSNLGLTLNKKKSQIFPLDRQSIEFLGFRYRISSTSKVLKTVDPNKVSKEKRRIRKQFSLNKVDVASVDLGFKSWKAHASGKKRFKQKPFLCRCNNYYVIQRMNIYYQNERRKYEQRKIKNSCKKG
jgi:RNA-directed DNA polymerase